MLDKETTKISNQHLEPLIKYAHANRGAMREILIRLRKRTRKRFNRENIARWLTKDKVRRTQPLFGVGLLLVEIGDDLMNELRLARLSGRTPDSAAPNRKSKPCVNCRKVG